MTDTLPNCLRMIINDRIFKLIELLEMNPNSFAEAIGVKGTVIFNIIKGRRNKPSFDVLEKILFSFEEVSPKWLIKGEGNVLTKEKEEKTITHVTEETGIYKRKAQIEKLILKLEADYKLSKRSVKSLRAEIEDIMEDNLKYRDQIIQLQESHDKVLKILRDKLNLKI
jgi:transcriptional regulator with XRE-family HTH domain